MPDKNFERLAVVETRQTDIIKDVTELVEVVDRIDKNVQTIQLQLSKQSGFIAGIMLILTPLWLGVLYIGKQLWEKLVDHA